jgi:tetratricopeptide (TPR) repeat protein
MAGAAERAGDFDLAIATYREAVPLASRIWKGPALAVHHYNYGRCLLVSGRVVEAEASIRRALAEASAGPESRGAIDERLLLAQWFRAAGKVDLARKEATAIVPERAKLSPERSARLTHLLGLLAFDEGRREEGLREMEKGESEMLAAMGSNDSYSFLIRLDRAEILRRIGRREDASVLSREIEAAIAPRMEPKSPYFIRLRRLQE